MDQRYKWFDIIISHVVQWLNGLRSSQSCLTSIFICIYIWLEYVPYSHWIQPHLHHSKCWHVHEHDKHYCRDFPFFKDYEGVYAEMVICSWIYIIWNGAVRFYFEKWSKLCPLKWWMYTDILMWVCELVACICMYITQVHCMYGNGVQVCRYFCLEFTCQETNILLYACKYT